MHSCRIKENRLYIYFIFDLKIECNNKLCFSKLQTTEIKLNQIFNLSAQRKNIWKYSDKVILFFREKDVPKYAQVVANFENLFLNILQLSSFRENFFILS